jgi:predicted Zn-dependent protease
VREISLESLDDNARIALDKVQQAISENFFHYAQALLFTLLERYPACSELRTLIRQTTVALKTPPANHVVASLRVSWTACTHLGGRRRPLKLMNDLERILADAPDSRSAHRLFARTALAHGYPHAAILSLETLRILWPALTHEQLLLAKAYMEIGRTDDAQELLGGVLHQQPRNDTAAELARQVSVKRAIRPENWQTASVK